MEKRKSLMVAVVLGVFCACLAGLAQAAQGYIARDGQPLAEIVVAERPARMARLAASELQAYIEKISGAKLPIVAEPTGQYPVAVYVGKSAHTERLGIDTSGLAHGAYRVASGENWLALVGPDTEFEPVEPYAHSRTGGSGGRAEWLRLHTEWDKITGATYANPFHYLYPFWSEELQVWEFDDAGTLNAVCDFLRDQGVRWYYPGDLGEIVPRADSIALPRTDAVVRPDFDVRKPGFWSKRLAMTPEEDLWTLRLGINQGADVIGLTQLCHGSKYVHLREEFKEAYPHVFALWGGSRATGHKGTQGAPCLSSREFFLHHLNYSRAVFDHYDEPMISIDVVDGYGRGVCECPKCQGKGTPERGWYGLMSDYVLEYMNRVAEEMQQSHPDKMVSALSYGAYREPPESIESFPPNMALWICQARQSFGDENTRREFLELREAWLEKLPSKEIYIYEYYMTPRPGGAWEGIPTYIPRIISEDLRSLKGFARGEFIDFYQPHDYDALQYDYLAVNHLNLYVTTRLWWDADQDIDALLEEYYANFYGPARAEMKAFIEHCEQNWSRMRTDADAIAKAFELVEAARGAAPAGTPYAERVAKAVEYIQPMRRISEQLAVGREDVPAARALRRDPDKVTIDGKLDEEDFWNVRPYQLRGIEDGSRPENPATFWPVWAGDSLYIGIELKDADMENVTIGTTQDNDPGIWAGDVVEVLIETQYHSYYQIAINPAGAVVDLDRSQRLDTRWSAAAEVATHRGEDGWTVEIRLPAAGQNAKDIDPLHGIAGDKPSETYPWYINVCRQRVRGEDIELTSWSPTGQSRFNVPEKFGKVWSR